MHSMAQTPNFRVNQLAKDFNLKSKELVELLAANGLDNKTHMAVLEPNEANLLLDLLTNANQITGIDDYMNGKTTIKVKKKAPKAEEAPVAETPKEEPKAEAKPEVKPEPKVEAPKEEPKAEVKAEAPKTEAPKAEVPKAEAPKAPETPKPAPAKTDAPKAEPRAEGRPAQGNFGDRRPQGQGGFNNDRRPQGGFNNDRRPQGQGGFNNDRRPQGGFNNDRRPQGQGNFGDRRPQGGFNNNNQRQNEPRRAPQRTPVPQQPSEPRRRTGEMRIVDTRSSSVDLSKYDERLDTFVSEKVDAGASKQKLKKQNTRAPFSKKREKESQALDRLKKENAERFKKQQLHITIPDEISVGELASRLKVTAAEVIKRLMLLGTMATVNEIIDYDTAFLIADELGAKATREVVVTIEERLFDDSEDSAESLVERSPVVVVMGHVDHGKTSLLDAIRHTHVTSGEAGGITQHIGAYRVNIDGKDITFLDTPGHEAFTAMRARGAQATDIAILVVAADDGIMPQTIEAINHAKAAGVEIIVAINKMDKPTANPDQVKQNLTMYDLVPEEWGGDVICVPVSALTRMGIDDLLENVLLVAEMKELRANPARRAKGIVIEAKLDRGRGPVATVLVQNGTLHAGDIVIAGTSVGRVRAMVNERGEQLREAGPSVPVEIIGLAEVPLAGDEFNAVEDERMARELAEQRRTKAKEEVFRENARVNLDALFAQISEGTKELNIIVKADVGGSAEAVKSSLLKLSNEEVKVRIIHTAVGGITEGDVMLAAASNAIIVGFNVRPDKSALDSAQRSGVDIRTYRIIYECIEEITAAMKGMLAPQYKEVLLGHAEVRQTIHVPNVGTIAGSYIQDGKITRASQIRVLRDGVVIFEDKISSLRRFKDDVREVAQGYECGVGLERFNDIKEGDILEAFIMEEVER